MYGFLSAECLHTVTEDNQSVISEMQELGTLLQQFLNSQSDEVDVMLLRVLISGKKFLNTILW